MKPDPSTERRLLDALEDAEDDLKAQQRLTKGISIAYGFVILTTLSFILPAQVFDNDKWYIGSVIGGIVSLISTVGMIVGWADGDLGAANQKRKLRVARREHRNYMMDINS